MNAYLVFWFVTFIIALICSRIYKAFGASFIKRFVLLVVVFVGLNIKPVVEHHIAFKQYEELCDTDSGIKVYSTVELSPAAWDEDGRPLFIDSSYDYEFDRVPEMKGKYRLGSKKENITLWGGESNLVGSLIETIENTKGEVLAEGTTYSYSTNYSSWYSSYNSYYRNKQCPHRTITYYQLSEVVFIKKGID